MKELFKWKECEQKMKKLNFTHELYSEHVVVKAEDGSVIGKFLEIEHLYHYLLGYDKGQSTSRA